MDKPPETSLEKEEKSKYAKHTAVLKEELTITVEETHQQTVGEFDEEEERRYQESIKKYEEGLAHIRTYGQELKELFHKSQDTFEKQLSYISAGALALSVGFIKDIVIPIKTSSFKWMLLAGWGLLILTLLLNLISHMLAGKYAKKGAKETEDIENAYDPVKIDKRARRMECINWATVGMLAGGIILIVLYITFNAIL